MKVHLRQIPSEGFHLEGEEPKDILELPAEEGIRQAGPVHYALDVGLSGDGLWATGTLFVDAELHCVRCLAAFVYPAHVPDVALQVELPPGEMVDLTPHLREDILLALPDYPHCDWSGERVCPGHRKTEEKPADEPVRPPSAWETLDQINISSN